MKLTIVKGDSIVFDRSSTSIESLLLEASPLFINRDQYVIHISTINSSIATFIINFNISNIIDCDTISATALKLLQKQRYYIVFKKKIKTDSPSDSSNFRKALKLPISEVVMLFSFK